MEPFQEGDPYPGQIKGKRNREMANKLPDRTAAKPQPKRKRNLLNLIGTLSVKMQKILPVKMVLKYTTFASLIQTRDWW
jgi:hypothetical protein